MAAPLAEASRSLPAATGLPVRSLAPALSCQPIDVAAIAERTTHHRPLAIEPVAPQSGRSWTDLSAAVLSGALRVLYRGAPPEQLPERVVKAWPESSAATRLCLSRWFEPDSADKGSVQRPQEPGGRADQRAEHGQRTCLRPAPERGSRSSYYRSACRSGRLFSPTPLKNV
jgi:hypothetical protein